MHLALYRKFRPQNFDEVVAQTHITTTLKNQIASGEISHAYLFNGTRGTGKTSIAKIFAKAVNCESPVNGNACGKCDTCVALSQPNSMDILEIDAASNNRVDEIRELRDKVKYPPVNGKYKVYIIDEVHMLTDSAFNALLKTLEEPPAHVVFILATTEVQKLPATILSRCMRFDFKLVSEQDLQLHLKNIFEQSQISYEPEALALIASMGEGSVRDTLSVADTVASFSNKNVTYKAVLEAVGAIDRKVLFSLGESILNSDAKTTLTTIDNIIKLGKNVTQIAKDLALYFRELAIIKTTNNFKEILALPEDLIVELQNVANNVTIEKVLQNLKAFASLENEFRNTLNPRLTLEVVALSQSSDKINELENRVAELESILAAAGDDVVTKKKPRALNIDHSSPEIIKVVEITSDSTGFQVVGEVVDKLPSANQNGKDKDLKNKSSKNETELNNENNLNIDSANNLVNNQLQHGNLNNYFVDGSSEDDGAFIVNESDFVYNNTKDYNSDANKYSADGNINKNWLHGKLLVLLREDNELPLHSLLGEFVQIKIENNDIVFVFTDEVKEKLFNREKNLLLINNYLTKLGFSFKIKTLISSEFKQVKPKTIEEKLKEIFKDKLILK